MKVLLFGVTGQVGRALVPALQALGEVHAPRRGDPGGDLSRPEEAAALVDAWRPAIVVNAAAYTAVDRAESEPALAEAVNARAPGAIAQAAARCGAWLVHYSTDYVFDGSGRAPWREADPHAPLSVYGRTKLAGEQAIVQAHPRHLILRTSWVHGPVGGNFIRTMLRLAAERDRLDVVDDQVGAPTGAPLIAQVTVAALRRLQSEPSLAGLYHLSAAGETSWHGYARFVLEHARSRGVVLRAGPEAVHPLPTSGYPTPARRPLNSRLDTARLRAAFGLVLPPWQEGVRQTVDAIIATP